MNRNNQNLNNSKPDQTLHKMRFCAQIAEKAGYTIAGVAAAHGISGTPGIISFGVCMLLFANLQSQLIFTWRLALGCRTLRISLLLRALSFTALAFGAMKNSIGLMLIGAALSGLFVGLFWPTFYTMKKEGIGGWFAVEKTSGVLLTVSTGVLLIYTNLLWILLFALCATLCSFAFTFRISHDSYEQHLVECKPSIDLSRPRRIALLDGAIGESLRMIRRLALLTGTVTFLGLEGILSFALVIGISEASGALLTRINQFKPIHFVCLAFLGNLLCILGTEYWLWGLILLGMSLSGLFPILQNEVKHYLDSANVIDLNFRERNRIEGRTIGALLAASLFLLQIPLESVFVGIGLALLLLVQTSDALLLRLNLPKPTFEKTEDISLSDLGSPFGEFCKS